MDDIIKLFRFGYLDAINDINSGYNNKNFINIVNKDFLSQAALKNSWYSI